MDVCPPCDGFANNVPGIGGNPPQLRLRVVTATKKSCFLPAWEA
jgi:hypothetical protein